MDTKKSASGVLSTGGLVLTVIQSVHPEWLGSHAWILPTAIGLFGLSLLYFSLQFETVQHLFGIRPSHQPAPPLVPSMSESLNPTATATVGNISIINNKVDPDEIAKSVAKILDEKQLPLRPGDGFVQLEDSKFNLQVPSVPLQDGQTFSLKYFYANRGGLPVYDVQTWGLLHIVIIEKNPEDHLRKVMLEGVKKGHEKFPDKGATLGVGIEHHSFATLTEPLTEKQIHAVKQGECALVLMVGGVWRDNRNEFHYWVEGRKAELPNFPELDPFRWKGF